MAEIRHFYSHSSSCNPITLPRTLPQAAIEVEEDIVISSATLVETLIVATRGNIGVEAASLIGLGLEVASVTLRPSPKLTSSTSRSL